MKKPIYYSKFTLFEDPSSNIFFNQLFTLLCNTFTLKEVEENLMIDGALALLIQGFPARPKTIELCCAHEKINMMLRTSIYALPITNAQIDDEHIVFKANSKLVKIKFLTSKPSSIWYQGIAIRDAREIKL